MEKISSLCPLCKKHKVDLYDSYDCFTSNDVYVIKCYSCGVSMEDVDKLKLIQRWKKLCDDHSVCLSDKEVRKICDDIFDRLTKIVLKHMPKTSMNTKTIEEMINEMEIKTETNEEMLKRTSNIKNDSQPIVDPIFENINKMRENY